MHKRRQRKDITYSGTTLAAGHIRICQCKEQRPVSSPNTIQDLTKKYRVEGEVRYCHLTITKSKVSCLTVPTLDIKWRSVYAMCESSGSTWLYKISYNEILYKTTSLLFTSFTHDVSVGTAGVKFCFCAVCLNL